MSVPAMPPLFSAVLNTPENFPSWYAGGITAGLTVFIFPIVRPAVVPNVVALRTFCDADVAVVVCALLLANSQLKPPLT